MKASSPKRCPEGKIVNPKTGRCVLKTGKIGLELLSKGKKPTPVDNKKKILFNDLLNVKHTAGRSNADFLLEYIRDIRRSEAEIILSKGGSFIIVNTSYDWNAGKTRIVMKKKVGSKKMVVIGDLSVGETGNIRDLSEIVVGKVGEQKYVFDFLEGMSKVEGVFDPRRQRAQYELLKRWNASL
jgi:hypothetical protein